MHQVVVKTLLVLLFLCAPVLADDASAPAGPTKEQVKEASKHWSRDGYERKKVTGKRVAIVEFTVDYITKRDAKVGGNNLGLGMVAGLAGMGKREYEFEESLRTSLPDEIYDKFVAALRAQGFDVVSKEAVANSQAIEGVKEGKAGVEKSGGGYYHGFFGGKGSQKVRIYPVSGLPRIKDGMFDAGKNMQAVTAVMAELGADIGMRVHMRVGLNDGRATAEEGSVISLIGAPKAQTAGGKTQYWAQTWGTMASKKTLKSDDKVVDSKEFEAFKGNVFTVNSALYRSAILDLISRYSDMAAIVLDKK